VPEEFVLEPGGANAYRARGALNFDSATRAFARGADVLRPGAAVEMDLSNVGEGDSAGLAVLIEWLAIARSRNVALRYTGIPSGILAIARIAEIEDLLTR
jgi:phospholipid transport system transporter-binding protein